MELNNVYIPANLNLINSSDFLFSTQGNDMAELTWENGKLSVNELGLELGSGLRSTETVGTLESIVNLATHKQPPLNKADYDDINVPWFDCRTQHQHQHQHQHQRSSPGGSSAAAASVTDALVPCSVAAKERQGVIRNQEVKSVGTCEVSGFAREKKDRSRKLGACVEAVRDLSLTGSVSRHVSMADTCEKGSCGFGVATTSFCSLATTRNITSIDDNDESAECLTRSQEDTCEKKKGSDERSSLLTKRSRAAAIHNQSERKRRETINEKMKILQKMVPNSSKTDKSSMLDEVIEYLKQLQAQVHMMMISRMMSIPSMMMPLPQHPFHMPMMSPMGIVMNMNMNTNMAHQNLANLAAPLINPSNPFMPVAPTPWDAATSNMSSSTVTMGSNDPSSCLARSQPESISMEAYGAGMIAMMQQQQQQQQQ